MIKLKLREHLIIIIVESDRKLMKQLIKLVRDVCLFYLACLNPTMLVGMYVYWAASKIKI